MNVKQVLLISFILPVPFLILTWAVMLRVNSMYYLGFDKWLIAFVCLCAYVISVVKCIMTYSGVRGCEGGGCH